MSRLDDKIALVTGSTSGLGRAIAVAFAGAGARVVIHGRDKQRADDVVEQLAATGATADAVLADLADSEQARGLVDQAVALTGGLDIVVNCAGVMSMGNAMDITEDVLDESLAINFKAPLLITQRALPFLIERHGCVLNVTTGGAHRSAAGAAVYAAAKTALHRLTTCWAAELAPQGVRVNELVPGAMDTPMMAPLLAAPEVQAMLAQRIPMGRIGQPEDVARAAVFLASDDASYVTGAVLAVDGGFLTA